MSSGRLERIAELMAEHETPGGGTWGYDWSWKGERLARSGRHYYAGLPPLPAGRRLRQAEHARRWIIVYLARKELIDQLRARFRGAVDWKRLSEQLPRRPSHVDRQCGPGVCPICKARSDWRGAMAALLGVPVQALEGIL